MALSIRLAKDQDLSQILDIYAAARQFMALSGNPTQWGTHYPQLDLVQEDLQNRNLYVCVDGDRIVGVFCYFQGVDEDYLEIYEGSWLSDQPYGVMHRLAVLTHSRGVAACCMEYAYSQCGNLRIDTHRDNLPMQRALAKNGFQRCGIIRSRYGGERIAYQKTGV